MGILFIHFSLSHLPYYKTPGILPILDLIFCSCSSNFFSFHSFCQLLSLSFATVFFTSYFFITFYSIHSLFSNLFIFRNYIPCQRDSQGIFRSKAFTYLSESFSDALATRKCVYRDRHKGIKSSLCFYFLHFLSFYPFIKNPGKFTDVSKAIKKIILTIIIIIIFS